MRYSTWFLGLLLLLPPGFCQDRNTGDKDHYYRVPVQKDAAGNVVGGGFSYRLPDDTWELQPDKDGQAKYLVAYGPRPAIVACPAGAPGAPPNSYQPRITVNDFRAGRSLMDVANDMVSGIASGKLKTALEGEYKDIRVHEIQLVEGPKPGRTERNPSVELVIRFDFVQDGLHYEVSGFIFLFQAKHEPNTKFKLTLFEHLKASDYCNGPGRVEITGDSHIEGPATSFDMTR